MYLLVSGSIEGAPASTPQSTAFISRPDSHCLLLIVYYFTGLQKFTRLLVIHLTTPVLRISVIAMQKKLDSYTCVGTIQLVSVSDMERHRGVECHMLSSLRVLSYVHIAQKQLLNIVYISFLTLRLLSSSFIGRYGTFISSTPHLHVSK